MKKVSYFFDHFIFIVTTLAIAGVFYEGMKLEWYSVVGVFILFMDYSFLFATIINLFVERKSKWIYVHVFSLIILSIAIVMKAFKIDYSAIALVLWYFYIWFVFGIRIAIFYLKRR